MPRFVSAHFYIEHSDDLGDHHALGGVDLPASLDHLLHSFGKLWMFRTGRPTTGDFTLVGERNSPRGDLRDGLAPFNSSPTRHSSTGLTSQTRTPSTYAGPSGSVYEDLCLGECKRVTKVRLGRVAYNLKVPMNNIQCVHAPQTTCDI